MQVNYYSFPNPEPIAAGEVQVVDIARHLSFNRGAIVKYVARAGRKSPETELQDLEKARDHLNDEIEWVKSQRATQDPGEEKPPLNVKYFGLDENSRPVVRHSDGTVSQGWAGK